MNTRYVIEDEAHSEWCGEFNEFGAAVQELRRRASLPWDTDPNVAPCTNWRQCGRNYEIIQFNAASHPWQELSRTPALSVSASGVQWLLPPDSPGIQLWAQVDRWDALSPNRGHFGRRPLSPALALKGNRMATANTASPIFGDKLYQERARAALPLLVRQAEAASPVFYSSLARELDMPNPRNLNYVLGCIGQTIEQLSKRRPKRDRIPPIQCLVVNKATGLPGEGIGWFLVKKEDFSKLPMKRRREIVQAELQHVYAYRGWRQLLGELELEPIEVDFSPLVRSASSFRGGGESPEHRVLKEFVAANPAAIGLPPATPRGSVEFPLASGDCLDVLFRTRSLSVAAEIKSARSSEADLTRGIFQCIKYRAVLEATLIAESQPPNARAILVLGGTMPSRLLALANLLGVEFVQQVSADQG